MELCDAFQIWTKFLAVADRDLHGARLGGCRRIEPLDAVTNGRFQNFVIRAKRIESNQKRTISRVEIANAGYRIGFEHAQQSHHFGIRLGSNGLSK